MCAPCRCVSRSEAHGWVTDTCALSKGALDQMQAQSSRLGRERVNATLGGQHFGEPQGAYQPHGRLSSPPLATTSALFPVATTARLASGNARRTTPVTGRSNRSGASVRTDRALRADSERIRPPHPRLSKRYRTARLPQLARRDRSRRAGSWSVSSPRRHV